MHILLFCLMFSLVSPVFTDEDYSQISACCTFKGPGLKDIEYILLDRFNKKVMKEFNSTRGNWTGFTKYSIEVAKSWNADPYDALRRAFEKKILCTDRKDYLQDVGNFTATPTVKLNSLKHPPVLVCSAYNFYPKQIRLTWLRNGQEVTSAVSFSEAISDGDWNYQIHSYLEHQPTAGEKITCMVEHFTLSKPALHVWDPSLPAAQRIKIAVGLCGLMIGFVVVTSGFIYYKRKSAAYVTQYQGRVSIPVEQLPGADST
ncbi:rano class II histocompatibility antigen, A beta chain-like [Acanthopagrus latus]|uniref:rano class II histocompatibility antigen, A beta chain-like n=1 Tax=Acanthopagrus latus TaxID=8177 RepID=UPI00187CE0B5|nr:rano class II histocompatibility antigen, A beta chain-like [Acanthopagrus latus]XP_036945135.1 rano class II histocompatibility antigen, A beta chain-like [Acanthopagrus latus]